MLIVIYKASIFKAYAINQLLTLIYILQAMSLALCMLLNLNLYILKCDSFKRLLGTDWDLRIPFTAC
jgi:hypothetical protein